MARSNYVIAYREACRVLSETPDPEGIALRASCRFDPAASAFELPFIGRLFQVGYPGGEVVPGEPLAAAVGAPPAPAGQALLTAGILILHYLCKAARTAGSAGSAAASGVAPGAPATEPGRERAPRDRDWIAFRELPGGNIYVTPFTNRTIRPMVSWFSREPERLVRAAERLGGRRADFGHASAVIDVLPLVPICFVLWQGDDEVPSSGQILFDRSASDYLDTEDLVVAAAEALYAARAADGAEEAVRPGTLELA